MSEQTSGPGAWDEVLKSRPALSAEVKIYPHVYRGIDWYLLVDQFSSGQLMLDETGYLLLRELDGTTTVEDALTRLADNQGLTLDEVDVAPLFARLLDAGMLAGDMKPTANTLDQHGLIDKGRRLKKFFSPFAIKVPLFDPDKLLGHLSILSRLCFTGWGAMTAFILIAVAMVASIDNWVALEQHWDSRFQDPVNLVWLLVLYPLVKTLHELGHGLAARHWGAEIHEMGVMFLVFIPVPYVDASSTATFYSARHRMAVAAAGILTESIIAAVAILGWFYTGDGLLNDLLFNIAVIGGVSTLLFNGNPLLRFDGYYVLSDALQIPNLGPRATAYLGYLFRTYMLGIESFRPPMARGEAAWLALYGLASGLYRLLIGFTIALYVAGRFFVFGMLLAVWFLLYQMLRPLVLSIWRTAPQASAEGKLGRFTLVMLLLFAVLPWLMFAVPLPQSTVAPGVIIPPETSHLRVATSGFVGQVYKTDGDSVERNDVLFELHDQELLFEEQRLVAEYDELDAQFRRTLTVDQVESERFKAAKATVATELAEIRDDIAHLKVKSQAAGRFSGSPGNGVLGRYFKKGDVLGYVTRSDDWTARVMVSQEDIDLVRSNTRVIQAISYSDPFTTTGAWLDSETPLAKDSLPAKSLGTQGGGYLRVDARDPEGKKLVTPMFEVTVRLPDADYLVGQTILVRFLHESEPAGTRLLKWLRRLLSSQLGL